MKTPVEICTEIAAELSVADEFTFFYGVHPDQNFDVDELETEGGIFLDPVEMKSPTTLTNVDNYTCTLNLFFGYKQETDAKREEKNTFQKDAIEAAREFVLRLRNYDKQYIRSVGDKNVVPVENVFDINLCGCFLTVEIVLVDASPTCL